MKLSRERALRFLQLAIGAGGKDEGRMEDYFSDVLGLGMAPNAEQALQLLAGLDDQDPQIKVTKEGKKKTKGLRKFVAHLRAVADALDPERRPIPVDETDDDDDDDEEVE
jgi:hypothetical protein